MRIIDSDTHVIEGDDMFGYLTVADREIIQRAVIEEPDGSTHKSWVIDGKVWGGVDFVADLAAMTAGVRDLSDVAGRLRQMDDIGTDVQVIYPSMFLRPPTSSPVAELALCRAYNRWLSERTADTNGRLQWAIVPPLLTLESAVEEIRYGAEHGAKAVCWRGFENGMLPTDPYFFPVLAEMDSYGLPMCVHAGNGTPMLIEFMPENKGIWRSKLAGVTAFHELLASDLPSRFPNVRFGFVELAAQWIPYVLKDHVRRAGLRDKRTSLPARDAWRTVDVTTLMAEKRMYVACQTDDDLAYLLQYAGPDNLISGSDFGHADTASELLALRRIRETPGVDAQALDNICDANPAALYRI